MNVEESMKRFEAEEGLRKDLKVLDECCKDISEGCDIHCYLEEGRLSDTGEVETEIPVGDKTVLQGFTNVELFFNMTTKCVTVVIHFKNPASTEKASIYNLYELYQRRSDEFFRHGDKKIAHFSLFFARQDEIHGIATVVDCHNPLVIFKDDKEGTLTCLFDIRGFHYGVQLLDYDRMHEEIQNDIAEKEMMERREEQRQEELQEQADFANQFISVVNEDEDF